MKNGWLVWLFIIGIIVVVFIAFNYNGNKNAVPLSEIFPEEETYPLNLEYEFVEDTDDQEKTEPAAAEVKEESPTIVKNEVAEEPKKIISNTTTEKKEISKTIVPDVKDAIPFTIQVASFSDKNKADKKSEDLKKDGYQAFVASRDLGQKGIWYRVYVGKFSVVEEAEKLLTDIKKKYPNSFIISPK